MKRIIAIAAMLLVLVLIDCVPIIESPVTGHGWAKASCGAMSRSAPSILSWAGP